VDEQQGKLLGANGLLHPAECIITELALVETTDDDPTKWQARREVACRSCCGVLACLQGLHARLKPN